ncbi:glycosyltransferase [Marinobacter orientalis]|nr:glycosyltransferase [Marinobacter orientalis]
MVSVIIPAFNRVEYIKETIQSVLDQNYPNIEIIAVDDGSSDGTYDVLKRFSDEKTITLLSHDNRENKGQSAALNVGLRAASGELLAILDSDDLFAPTKIAEQVEFLEADPSFDMVYGNGLAVDRYGNPLFYTLPENHTETGDPARVLVDCYVAIPGGALIRRTLIEKVGFFEESFRAAQDHDMAIRLFEAGKVGYLPTVAFHYRKHEDSISQKGLERRWSTGFEVLRRAQKRYPYPSRIIRKRAAVLNFRLGQTYWRESRRIIAVPLLVKSAMLDPLRALKVLLGRERVV